MIQELCEGITEASASAEGVSNKGGGTLASHISGQSARSRRARWAGAMSPEGPGIIYPPHVHILLILPVTSQNAKLARKYGGGSGPMHVMIQFAQPMDEYIPARGAQASKVIKSGYARGQRGYPRISPDCFHIGRTSSRSQRRGEPCFSTPPTTPNVVKAKSGCIFTRSI